MMGLVAQAHALFALAAKWRRERHIPPPEVTECIRRVLLQLQDTALRSLESDSSDPGANYSPRTPASVFDILELAYIIEDDESGYLHSVSARFIKPASNRYRLACFGIVLEALELQVRRGGILRSDLLADDLFYHFNASKKLHRASVRMLLTLEQQVALVQSLRADDATEQRSRERAHG